jgi:DNA-binding response OmpR family regulator
VKKRILYVEDEQSLGKIVTETLEKLEFEVRWETDGKMVMGHLSTFLPDICILDIMLPNIDGYTLCKEISSICPDLPIIFLTARVETADLIKGFEAGGTDYIRKPFSLEELVVRINNQFRIKGAVKLKPSQISDEIKIGLFTFFPRRYELHTTNGIIKLSQREIQVLNHLVLNLNHVVDRKNLLLTVWGDDSFFNSRNLDVYIRKLRQYFKEDPSILIQTLKGKGYLFLVP